jgi:hypothetical protein
LNVHTHPLSIHGALLLRTEIMKSAVHAPAVEDH